VTTACASFFSSLSAGTHEIIYYLRAETPGQATHLSGAAYPMYNEKTAAKPERTRFEVTGP